MWFLILRGKYTFFTFRSLLKFSVLIELDRGMSKKLNSFRRFLGNILVSTQVVKCCISHNKYLMIYQIVRLIGFSTFKISSSFSFRIVHDLSSYFFSTPLSAKFKVSLGSLIIIGIVISVWGSHWMWKTSYERISSTVLGCLRYALGTTSCMCV